MKAAHTPGLWVVNGFVAPVDITDTRLEPSITAGEFYVATAHDFGDDGATSAANARLIAQAPAMYAALHNFRELTSLASADKGEVWFKTWIEHVERILAAVEGK